MVTTTTSIYEKIGGKAALQAVVEEFYQRVLADDLLKPFFEGTDMKKQRDHQVAFLAFALGGAAEYTGSGMQSAHEGRGIGDEHFAAVAGHLMATLQWAGVGEPELTQIMTSAAALRSEVVQA